MQPVTDAVAHFFKKMLHKDPAKHTDEIVRISNLIQKHAGISEYRKYLGDGGYGSAFRIDHEWTLKLTNDYNEVHASYAVQQAGAMPNVVEVTYAGIALGGTSAVGVIVLEYVPNLFWDFCFEDNKTCPTLLRDIVRAIKDKHGVWPVQLSTLKPREARRRLGKAQADLIRMLEVQLDEDLEQVSDGLRQLRGIGVYYVDCHPWNVGVFKLKQYEVLIKLFDLGISSLPPGTRAPTIEEAAMAGLGEPAICGRQKVPVMQ